ncbi:MAG: hypothetical protein J6B65_06595 [Paludibacteraceae bacterium]|nr:hypothetical protein [Paludibacteraceae bacterium]
MENAENPKKSRLKIFYIMKDKSKFLILSVVCLLFVSCITTNEKINQWKEYELKGKVRTLKTCTYSASEKFGEIVKDSLIETEIVYFNKKGLKDSVCNIENNKHTVYVYEWDFKNNKCIILEKVDGIINTGSYAEIQYNQQFNRLLSHINYDNDSIKYKEIYKYNEQLQMIDCCCYDGNGHLTFRIKDYEYNEKGLLVQEKWYNEKGELYDTYSYRYDDNGNQIGEKLDDSYRISKRLYKYNEDGLIVNIKYNYNLKRSSYSSTDVTEYTYRLDNKGNYILKTEKEYDEDDKSEVECKYIEREITYF